MRPSLSIVVTTFNEERVIADTIRGLQIAARAATDDYEIIVMNDASPDRTGVVAAEVKKEDPEHIRVINNPKQLYQAGNFLKGVQLATKEYLYSVGGDNRIEHESQKRFLQEIGQGDMVVLCYFTNDNIRHSIRRYLSWLFVQILNMITGYRLQYYNGPTIIRTEHLKAIKLKKPSFAFMAEIVIRLLKRGFPYKEVSMRLNPDPKGLNFRAVRMNFFPVVTTLWKLFWMSRVTKRFS